MTPSTEQLQKAATSVMSMYEEMGSLARDHFDATMKSAAAMTKGMDELARSTSSLVQDSVSRAVSASKTIMGARSIREVSDMHNEMMKDMFDNWVAATGRLSEMSARMTQDVVGPIAEQTNTAFHKIASKFKAAA